MMHEKLPVEYKTVLCGCHPSETLAVNLPTRIVAVYCYYLAQMLISFYRPAEVRRLKSI